MSSSDLKQPSSRASERANEDTPGAEETEDQNENDLSRESIPNPIEERKPTPSDSRSRASREPSGVKTKSQQSTRSEVSAKSKPGTGKSHRESSSRESEVGKKPVAEPDTISELNAPKTPPVDEMDQDAVDENEEEKNEIEAGKEGQVSNGFVRQETSLFDTITKMIPPNESEDYKMRIREALNKLANEYTGSYNCSDCEIEFTIEDVHVCVDCAKWLCNACKNHHQRVKTTRTHQLYTPPSVSGNECQVHSENFSLFCLECDSLVCNQCICQEHKKHEMMSIDQKETLSKQVLEELQGRVDLCKTTSDERIREIKERTEQLREFEGRAKIKIEARFATLRKLLDSIEKDALLELDMVASDAHAQLMEKQDAVKKEMDEVTKCEDSIKKCGKRNRVGLINTLPMTETLVNSIYFEESRKPVDLVEPSIVENNLREELFTADAEKHVLRVTKTGRMKLVDNCVIVNQMNVRSPQDSSDNVIYDMCRVTDDKLIVLDNRNKSVKMVEDSVVSKEVYHDNCPCRVTCNEKCHLVIVCDDKYILYSYDFDLNFKGVLEVPVPIRKPYGLDVLASGNLLVGDRHDGQLYELCLNGPNWLSVVRQIASGFSCVDYVSAAGDKLAVSHGNGNSVRVLSIEDGRLLGEVDQVKGNLNWPLGLIVDVNGNVVVCDSCNHRVLVFSPQGDKLKEIKGFYLPRAVKLSENHEVLMVAERGGRIKLLSYMQSTT